MKGKIKEFKASAMIYALIFLYITSLIAIGLINLFESQLKLASSKIRLEQRYKLADTGLDIALSFLKTHGIPSIGNLKSLENQTYTFGNYNLKVYIFDKNCIKSTLSGNVRIKDIEDELARNGVNNFLNELNGQNNSDTAELPYLVVSRVNASKGKNLYKIALVNLEYFSRYAYFSSEMTFDDRSLYWIFCSKDRITGPFRTNSNFINLIIPHDYYQNDVYLKPTFIGKVYFTGDLRFINNPNGGENGINIYGELPCEGDCVSEERVSQIVEGGLINIKANSSSIDLASELTNEDAVKNQIWPGFDNDIQSNNIPQDEGIFIKTDDNSNIVSALLINPEDDGKIYSLDLKVVQNVQAYQIKFEKDDNEKDITIYKVDNTNFNIPSDGIINPNFKVRVINNLDPNSSINLMNYFEDDSSFEDQGNSYSVSGKALVLTRIKDNAKQVVVISLDNSKPFPKNVIWVNGSIGDRLEEDNMEGGLSGEYNEPLTVISKPAAKRDINNFNNEYQIRIKGDLKPYGMVLGQFIENNQTSILGLYADKIFISYRAPIHNEFDIKGIYIYASLLALKAIKNNNNVNTEGSFGVEKVLNIPFQDQNIIHIYGSLVQNYGEFTGLTDGSGNIIKGFVCNYNYDARLAYMNPPYFPTTGEYIILFEKILTNY